MADALDRAPEGVKILSLDCFDTLLWRDCHAPDDLFAGLHAVNARQRAMGEKLARKAERARHSRSEVALPKIYEQAMPVADDALRGDAIEAELALEARTCFAFAPTVALIRAAAARKMRVIIVSDTYLSARQLRDLIAATAGEDIAGLIDRVVVSSEAGVSKSQGLLARVLQTMKCGPRDLLHVGDNRTADHDAARALGIPALHLEQFTKPARQRLRFERACQKLIGEPGGEVSGQQRHRALIARDEPRIEDPAEKLGFTVLGPVLHAFDRWLRGEAKTLCEANGGQVHWAFMLRDGHLPHLVHQAGGEAPSIGRVEISRFTASAASLTDRNAYDRQYALEHTLNPPTRARQMLLDEEEIAGIVGRPGSLGELAEAARRLDAELKTGRRRKLTMRRARARAKRLVEHVRTTLDPRPGDTIMLVDLGYNGSAQDRIDSLLREDLGVHVAGRYLIARETTASGLDKKGLFDASRFDTEWLDALCENVAVIEQLATCALGSVVDYDDAGEPVRSHNAVKGAQSAVRERVQAGAVRFARGMTDPPILRREDADPEAGWRTSAAGVLTRFLFLPQPAELAVVQGFEHDVNTGSDRVVSLFDAEEARAGLKRRGLFYMQGASRMFLPAEIAGEDMATRLSLLAQKRFALPFTHGDTGAEPIAIPALYVGQADSARIMVEAHATHAGHYTARLPVSGTADAIALQLGAVFEWFELGPVTCAPIAELEGRSGGSVARPIPAQFDGVVRHGDRVCECSQPSAFVLVNRASTVSAADPAAGAQMIEIAFRPLRYRPQNASRDHAANAPVTTLPSQPAPRENDAA